MNNSNIGSFIGPQELPQTEKTQVSQTDLLADITKAGLELGSTIDVAEIAKNPEKKREVDSHASATSVIGKTSRFLDSALGRTEAASTQAAGLDTTTQKGIGATTRQTILVKRSSLASSAGTPKGPAPTIQQAHIADFAACKTKSAQVVFLLELSPDQRVGFRKEIDMQVGLQNTLLRAGKNETGKNEAAENKLAALLDMRVKIDTYDLKSIDPNNKASAKENLAAKSKQLDDVLYGQKLLNPTSRENTIENLLLEVCELHIDSKTKDALINKIINAVKGKDFPSNISSILMEVADARLTSFFNTLATCTPNTAANESLQEVNATLDGLYKELAACMRPLKELEAEKTGDLKSQRQPIEAELSPLKRKNSPSDQARIKELEDQLKPLRKEADKLSETLAKTELAQSCNKKSEEICKRIEAAKAEKRSCETEVAFLHVTEARDYAPEQRENARKEGIEKYDQLGRALEKLGNTVADKTNSIKKLDTTQKGDQLQMIDLQTQIEVHQREMQLLSEERNSLANQIAALKLAGIGKGLQESLPAILKDGINKLSKTEAAKASMDLTLDITSSGPVSLQTFMAWHKKNESQDAKK